MGIMGYRLISLTSFVLKMIETCIDRFITRCSEKILCNVPIISRVFYVQTYGDKFASITVSSDLNTAVNLMQ